MANNEAFVKLVTEQERLLSAWNLSDYDREKDGFKLPESFYTYFEPMGMIALSDSVLHSRVSALDVDSKGRILLSDRSGRQVLLYQPDGRLNQSLETESCHPGYNFTPYEAQFDYLGRIFVFTGTRPYGFLFNNDGSCSHAIDVPAYGDSRILMDLDEKTYFYTVHADMHEVYSIDAERKRETLYTATAFSLLNSRMRGLNNFVSVGRSHLAIVQLQSPLAKLISVETGEIRDIGQKPSYYRQIENDLRDVLNSTEDIFSEIRSISEGKSNTIGVYGITESVLLLVHLNQFERESAMGLQIIDLTGRVVNSEPIRMPFYLSGFLGAQKGFLFRQVHDYEGTGMDSNPPIVVYSYLRQP